MDNAKFAIFLAVFTACIFKSNGCQYCGCYGTPDCDCYCPPWMYIGYDRIILEPARGQVSVSSSAAASVKYNKGAPQAYISSLSSAKADPKIPVNIVRPDQQGRGQPTQPPPSQGPPAPTNPPTKAPTPGGNVKHAWDYRSSDGAYGPANWKTIAPKCGGQRQSPVDIVTSAASARAGTPSMLKLVHGNPDATIQANLIVNGKLKNNGRALGFTVDTATTPIKLKFKNTYTLRQFHFHFSCEGEMGSEHSLDGAHFPGEIHLVFTNDKYADVKIAMQKKDGLVALAFFMKYDDAAENKAIKRISDNLVQLRMPHGHMQFPDGMSLANLIPALKEGLTNLKFFAYQGSLPTPPCYESVTWIVFRRPVLINPITLENWRNILQGDFGRMCGNFRPIQPLNGRKIVTFVSDSSGGTDPTAAPPTAHADEVSAVPPTAAPAVSAAPSAVPSGAAPSAAPSEEDLGARGRGASVENINLGPESKQKAFAKLVGDSAKMPDENHASADARQELHPVQQLDAGNLKESNAKAQTVGIAMQGQNSAFSKNIQNKDSKLIQVIKKGVDASSSQGGPNNVLVKKDESKPTVAPGMKRHGI